MECPAQILAQEVIGYHNVSLIALDDPRVGFDPVTQFGYISSCTDSRSASEYIQGVLPNLGCQYCSCRPNVRLTQQHTQLWLTRLFKAQYGNLN